MNSREFNILVAHAGKQHAYWHACALQQLGVLSRFVTSGYYRPDRWPDRLFAGIGPLHRALLRRNHPGLDSDNVTRRWSLEVPELLARRLRWNRDAVDRLVFRRDYRFDQWVARRRAGTADVFWGFQGSCCESLEAARRQNRIAVAELATVHAPAAVDILCREAERHPEWADSISNLHFPDWYRDRLDAEPHAADLCIAASSFTKTSLISAGVPEKQIALLPLGADLEQFAWHERSFREPTFRILFVGGVGQRKGIKYLLEAVRSLNDKTIELTIVGPPAGSIEPLRKYDGLYRYLGRMDQTAVVEQMHRSHVLVLPSVLEGFGLVIPEAMSTGLPVIASTHSAAPEIIREGVDGFVLPPDDVDGLAERLLRMHRDRDLCRHLSENSRARAQEFTWHRHRDRLAVIIDQLRHMRDAAALMTATAIDSCEPLKQEVARTP